MYNEPRDENEISQNQPQPQPQQPFTPPAYTPPPNIGEGGYGWYGYDPRYRMASPHPLPQKRSKLPVVLGVLFGFVVGAACLFIAILAWNDWSFTGYGDHYPNTLPSPPTTNNQQQAATPSPNLGGGTAKLDIVPVIPVLPTPRYDAEGRLILSNSQIIEKGQPSVVCILVEDANTRMAGSGSGIVMTDDGYIITNYHVVEGVTSIEVVMHDKTRYQAQLVGSDQMSDLAVIKVEAENLIPAEFGDSNALMVGDPVVVIGNPLGLELQGTATSGMISAINRDIEIGSRTMTTLQTDASVNQGNSGGPMFNQYGQVVGIISSKIMSTYAGNVEGLGFAIPITPAKVVIDDLVKLGYVSGRPTIGITNYEEITAAASRFFGLPQGVRILGISENSDAYKQGLRVDDLIIEVNGSSITTGDELNGIKNKYSVGDKISLTIYRNGQTQKITFELMEAGTLR